MTKKSRSLLFGALFLFAILLRIYRISTVPLGMHIDEAGLGLNAWFHYQLPFCIGLQCHAGISHHRAVRADPPG